jgi:hypothetical protein
MRVPEWLSWTAAIASIAGFVLSATVLAVACLWRRMAEGLLRAVRVHSLAEELGDLQSEVAELAEALVRGEAQMSRYIAQRAQARVGAVLARRGATLTGDDLTDLNRVRGLLAGVHQELSGRDELPPSAFQKCATHVTRSGGLLATVLGHTQSSVDLSVGKER